VVEALGSQMGLHTVHMLVVVPGCNIVQVVHTAEAAHRAGIAVAEALVGAEEILVVVGEAEPHIAGMAASEALVVEKALADEEDTDSVLHPLVVVVWVVAVAAARMEEGLDQRAGDPNPV
jgi:hypothetical protein